MNLNLRQKVALLAALAAAVSSNAFAAVDITAITGAQTDSLSVCAALLAMCIAVWGASFIRKKFFK